MRIAEKLPNYDDDSSDDLKREIRRLRSQNNFGEELQIYLTNYVPGFKLIEGKEKNICIGEVWEPIISSGEFPNLAKVLRSVLSIFHGTASVEEAINVT